MRAVTQTACQAGDVLLFQRRYRGAGFEYFAMRSTLKIKKLENELSLNQIDAGWVV